MMPTDRKLWTFISEESQIPVATTEASTIGLSPGIWPEIILILDENQEGYLLVRDGADSLEGEVMAMRYTTRNGCLKGLVLND